MDTPGHPLTLKVMRVSRPALASSWQPFFTSSPSFSAHATKSLLSLQGTEPLTGHPKTLRDLTHASQLLTLPSTFGAIQLGETFTSCLCLNNEGAVEVEGVSLRIEMQTATNKVLLAEVGGPERRLGTTDVLEVLVNHEMKELGQHVLACYVSYRLPSATMRTLLDSAGNPVNPSSLSFRKYYKFAVTNPLNVKTKVHVPRSPTAMLSRTEREKVFLEIHIQNLTPEPMWFERIHFECVDGWEMVDGNVSHKDGANLFSASTAIMQSQDIRQYVYILTPSSVPSFPVVHAPGTIIPLGRLDLSWRSSLGEPGRLLTSLLSRRIPLTTAHPPPSAIPPHLQQSRPHSPQQAVSRPSTPPGSPAPPKHRLPSHQIGRSQSPASSLPPPTPFQDLELDLVVHSIPRSHVPLEQPFKVVFELTLSALLPAPGMTRQVHLMIQHLQPTPAPSTLPIHHPTQAPINTSPRPSLDVLSPRVPPESASPSMSPKRGVFNFGLGLTQAMNESPFPNHNAEPSAPSHDVESISTPTTTPTRPTLIRLPSPFSSSMKSRCVLPLGASVISLPPFQLTRSESETSVSETSITYPKTTMIRRFECTFIPMHKGLANVGGLRVLLIGDREVEETNSQDDLILISHVNAEAKVLREWDVVGEVWITG